MLLFVFLKMIRTGIYATILLLLSLVTGYYPAIGQETAYTYDTPSRDGTGKFFMGREISQIMGFHGMAWLERPSRSEEENTDLAIANLPINKNSVVADIGAGSGYYTFRIAKSVPAGKVYAVEIQQDALDYIQKKATRLNFDQVVTLKGSEKSPNLPENAVDLAIMVDVYHELEFPGKCCKTSVNL